MNSTIQNLENLQSWSEKYRPTCINEIALDEDLGRFLSRAFLTSDIPHLLFHGPPGSGKTSAALVLAKNLFGSSSKKSRVLELNASDDRGIVMVREKIKSFASFYLPNSEISQHRTPFKLIILDEADNITPEAQNALRRTMETYSRTTRFCFICNFLSRIIDPLISRCAKFRFKPLPNSIVINKLNSICEKEGFFNLTKQTDVVQTLILRSKGDFRKLITNIQTISCLYGNSVTKQKLTDVLGLVPTEIIESIWSACITGSFDNVWRISSEVVYHGYSTIQILDQIFDKILTEHNIPEIYRSKISCHLASSEKHLLDCLDQNLQLADILQTISRLMNDKELKNDMK